jgi:protein arginine kinase
MSALRSERPLWLNADGPEADVVVTTRARLARSLAAYPFPERASREDLSMVARDVRRASTRLTERFPRLRTIRVEKLSSSQKGYLLDAHVASVEQVRGGPGRIVIADPSGRLSIMVNEEDHIRLQCLESGLAPEIAYEVVDWVDDALSTELEYGFSRELGYLTASVSNVGTGLRVSALMHLAGLAMRGNLASVLRAAWDLGVSVRGLFGEGSAAVGDLYQVSNEVTLGFEEKEIVQKVRAVAEYLLGAERSARKELFDAERSGLMETADRSLRTLQGAMSLRAKEAIGSLSSVRLAAALGVADNCPMGLMNEMLVAVRAGAGDDIGVRLERAALSRKTMARVHLKPG